MLVKAWVGTIQLQSLSKVLRHMRYSSLTVTMLMKTGFTSSSSPSSCTIKVVLQLLLI